MDDFAITITWIDYLNYNWHVTVQNDHIKGMKKVAKSSGRVHDAAVFYPSPNSLLLSFDKNNCWKIEYRMLYCMVTSISQPKIPHKEQEMQSACCDSLQQPTSITWRKNVINYTENMRSEWPALQAIQTPQQEMPNCSGINMMHFWSFSYKKNIKKVFFGQFRCVVRNPNSNLYKFLTL